MILGSCPLGQLLSRLASCVDTFKPGARAALLLTEQRGNGVVLRIGAAPSLPAEYHAKVDGMPAGPNTGCCASAVHDRKRVISADVLNDPRFASMRDFAARLELRSCWSEPVFSSSGEVLGVYAVYGRTPGGPDAVELEFISEAAKLCAIAIERRRADDLVRQTLADLASARDSLEARSTELLRRNAELAATSAESERLRRQAELDAIVAQELRKRADEANRAKSDFLANMSHEIRTPMTAILGFADLLVEGASEANAPGGQHDFVQAIRRNAEHLLSVVNDILDLTKIESGRLTIERIECNPDTILQDVLGLLSGRAAEKGIALECVIGAAFPGAVITDPTRLRQIAINLIGNAVKFTDDGRVSVNLAYEPSSSPELPGTMVLRVEDSGIGISEKQLTQLFEAFTQADPATSRRFGGSGLGLAISRRLARLLGGDVSATSALGEGSCFTVRIPCRTSSSQPAGTAITRDAGRLALAGRVLLAEDGPDNKRLIVHLLRSAGADVFTVANGQSAVDLCRQQLAAGTPFDLVLMDMQMPFKDGYEATRELRAGCYSQPILALTANVLTEQRRRAIECGCDDVIEKPIDRHRFLTLCRIWIERARSAAGGLAG